MQSMTPIWWDLPNWTPHQLLDSEHKLVVKDLNMEWHISYKENIYWLMHGIVFTWWCYRLHKCITHSHKSWHPLSYLGDGKGGTNVYPKCLIQKKLGMEHIFGSRRNTDLDVFCFRLQIWILVCSDPKIQVRSRLQPHIKREWRF